MKDAETAGDTMLRTVGLFHKSPHLNFLGQRVHGHLNGSYSARWQGCTVSLCLSLVRARPLCHTQTSGF